MEKFNNLIITSTKLLSQSVKERGLLNFKDLTQFVKFLPYKRISNRDDFTLVLTEGQGTCSTKHALLAQVALENNFAVSLHLGIYKMNEQNTTGVGTVLKKYKLNYIPEAHCYLKFENEIIDCTRETTNLESFNHFLLYEEEISTNQIGRYKIQMHRHFLSNWIAEHSVQYNIDQLWHIRELCINTLK